MVAAFALTSLTPPFSRRWLAFADYAGSHGFDIHGPDGTTVRHSVAESFLPSLKESFKALSKRYEGIAGAELEDNGFCFSVHYRQVRVM